MKNQPNRMTPPCAISFADTLTLLLQELRYT